MDASVSAAGTCTNALRRLAAGFAPRRQLAERLQRGPIALPERGRKCARKCRCGHSAGFTYIGLLMFIAAMSLGLTTVAQVWQTVQQRDKEEELLFVGNEIRRAIGGYHANAGRYPQKLEELLKEPGFPGVRRYLRKIYRDPLTGRAEWGLVKRDGISIIGIHSLSDAEPFKQNGFSLADQSFAGKKKYSEWVFVASGAQQAPAAQAPAAAAAQGSGAPSAVPQTVPGSAGATAPANTGATPADSGSQLPGRFGPRVRR